MAQFFRYPVTGGGSSSNASVGSNGVMAPSSSTEVAGINPSGNLQPLQTTADGSLLIAPDPGTTANVNVADFGGSPVVTGPGASGTGIPRVTVSNDSTVGLNAGSNTIGSINNISGTVSLPTGAATSALQTSGNSTLTTINTTLGSPFQAGGSIGNTAFGVSGSLPAGSNNIGSVNVANFPSTALPTTPLAGHQTSTGTAVAIGSGALVNGAIIQALAANAGNVYIGPSGVSTSTGFQLQPGQATSIAVSNLGAIYLISATSGDGICYIGS